MGVGPVTPGCRKIQLAPLRGHYTHAEATVHTPPGDVQVSWHLENDHMILDWKQKLLRRYESVDPEERESRKGIRKNSGYPFSTTMENF